MFIYDRGLPQTITRATRRNSPPRYQWSSSNGTPPQEVADLLCAAARSIFYWLARYRSGGWDGLQPARAGESSFEAGRSRHLRWIYETVTEGDPRQEGFPFALWTLKMIGRIIRESWA